MPVRPILEVPDPLLRKIAAPITDFSAVFSQQLENLIDSFHHYGGIGLAAPQIGYPVRALVMDLSDERNSLQVFVNPVVRERAGFAMVEESCISVPDVTGSVMRRARVRVTAQNSNGEDFVAELEGMAAICLQHEIDHLDGKLFIDRLPFWRRWSLKSRRTKTIS